MKLVCPACGETMGHITATSQVEQPTLEADLIEAHRCGEWNG